MDQQFKTKRDVIRYIIDHAERVKTIPAKTHQILDARNYSVGYVVSHDDSNTIWISDFTGSDVDEWAVVSYRLSDNDGNNTALITLLQTPTQKSAPKYDYPNGRVLDCGCTVYYKSEVMNTAHGTSCADHYDSMEGEDD